MILVAGGNGYLGQAVCRKLVQYGQPVISLDISSVQNDTYTSIVTDVRDRKELEKVFFNYPIETVVSLAAILASGSNANPFLSFQVNVIGNYHLLDLCHKYSVSRYIFGSSYAALGNPTDPEKYVDEDETPSPISFYGLTKAFIEKFGVSISELCGFQFVAARFPIIVGPGKSTPTSAWRADMFNLLSTGGDLSFNYAPDQILPLVHYDDAAEALSVLTISNDTQHHIYHLPYENWRLEELGRTLMAINPLLRVSYGNRKFEGAPINISFERFTKEFNLPQPALRNHLENITQ